MMACDCLYINATWCLTIPPSTPNQPPTGVCFVVPFRARRFRATPLGFNPPGTDLWWNPQCFWPPRRVPRPRKPEPLEPLACLARLGRLGPLWCHPWRRWGHCQGRCCRWHPWGYRWCHPCRLAWPSGLAGRIIDMLRATHSHHSGAWCRPIRWCQMEVPGRACWHEQR